MVWCCWCLYEALRISKEEGLNVSVNCRSLGWTVDVLEDERGGRRRAVATGPATDGFAVAVAVAIERAGGSGMWNEGAQAAGSGCGYKYCCGVTGAGSPFVRENY